MSVPKRFFVQNIAAETDLTGDEYRHAKNVLRLDAGDEITLLDGSGREYSAIVARVERGRMILNVTGERENGREPRGEIVLLIGALKGDKTELVVQKAVELGVSRVVVFSSRYCAAYMNENKLARLNRVSREAAKQCLRSRAPEVVYLPFEDALCSVRDCKSKYFACEFLEKSEGELLGATLPCAIVVGSEGGFHRDEFALAQSYGFVGVSLGKRVLRAETAAIAALSVVAYAAGELK